MITIFRNKVFLKQKFGFVEENIFKRSLSFVSFNAFRLSTNFGLWKISRFLTGNCFYCFFLKKIGKCYLRFMYECGGEQFCSPPHSYINLEVAGSVKIQWVTASLDQYRLKKRETFLISIKIAVFRKKFQWLKFHKISRRISRCLSSGNLFFFGLSFLRTPFFHVHWMLKFNSTEKCSVNFNHIGHPISIFQLLKSSRFFNLENFCGNSSSATVRQNIFLCENSIFDLNEFNFLHVSMKHFAQNVLILKKLKKTWLFEFMIFIALYV